MTAFTTSINPATITFPSGLDASRSKDGITIRLGNLYLTGRDSAGVEWGVYTPVAGLDGSPSSSRQSTQKTRAAGAWSGTGNLTARSLVLNGYMYAPTADALQNAVDQLNAAVTLTDTVLTVVRGTTARSLIVARQDEVTTTPTDGLARHAAWSIQLGADDPRKFAAATSASTGLPSVSGGFTAPFVAPFTSTAVVSSGLLSITNQGNATGPLWMRVDGPIVGPQITHVASGTQLVLSTALTLSAGQWIEIDMEAQTVLANGQSSRNGYILSRGWFGFDPGPNQFAFSAASGSGLLTIRATPSWL